MINGIRSTALEEVVVPGTCTSCGAEGSVRLHVMQRYAHVLWIPMFPLGKAGVSDCTHCKHVLAGKEMSTNAQQVFSAVKGRKKAPVWMFSGTLILALLIPWGIYRGKERDKEVKAMLLDPRVGDEYEIKLGLRSFTLYKVREVKGDSVFVVQHNYETTKPSGLSELRRKGDGEYGEDRIGFDEQGLLDLQEDGTIIDVDR